MKGLIIFISPLFVFYFSSAQQFGGNPSSIKWQQINTDTVRIIFPLGYDAKAQRVAAIVHALQKNYSHTIGDSIRKINIILQNQTLVSNGYVGLAPYRSEFFMTSPQNPFQLGAVSWADNLAVHEFRHVQQYSNFNKGVSKFAHIILGEQGQAVANALSIPDWFFEGDAVFNETKLTQQGRGTLPSFFSGYQSLFLENRSYSYMKMRNGSLKSYVPNHYQLGYLLVAYGRIKYGEDIWRKITDDAARFHSLFYPFQAAVKKYTGIPYAQFVNEAMLFFREQWKTSAIVKTEWVTPLSKNDVVNYQFPYSSENGSLIVLKSSNKQVPTFYKINADKTEEKIAVKNISTDNYFSYNNGKIIYSEFQPDTRWGNRDYYKLTLLDIKTKEENSLVSFSKFTSPDISHDGKLVLTVEMKPSGQSNLVLMNMGGEVLDSIVKSGVVFSQPKFSADDLHFYVAERNVQGWMSLIKYAKQNNKEAKTVIPFANQIIGYLAVQGDTLLFSRSYNGKDELWAIVDGPLQANPFRLATFQTGLYQGAFLQGGKMVASAFTADGYRLGLFKPLWEKVHLPSTLTDLYVSNIYNIEDHLLLNHLPQTKYSVRKYAKSSHLINIHSYRPFYEQPEYSFTIYGQNVMNTFQSELAYTYNHNEGSHKVGYNGIFGGSFLQPIIGISQTWDRSVALNKDTTVHWNELVGFAGLQLPLNLSGGKQYRFLKLSASYNIDQIKWTGIAEKILPNNNFQYLLTRLSYSGQIQKALQQIYPHWAQIFLLQYKSTINQFTAQQFLATGSLYLPGIMGNHSLVISAAYQSRDTLQQYLFSNNFPFSRGYTAVDFPRMWKIGVNYHLPLFYPDWGFGNIVYFQRIRSNLFLDYTEGKSLRTGTVYPFRTVGTELFFDTRWWNQQSVSFGIRYSRLLDNEFRGTTQPNIWELILPVNLFN